MTKKLKLPILLLAVVIMLSVFYIKEAQNNDDVGNVSGSNLNSSTLNPDFTEARIQSIDEINAKIKEYENDIASGELTANEIKEVNAIIDDLVTQKNLEFSLEMSLMDTLGYDDVYVGIEDEYAVINIYTDDIVDQSDFVKISRLVEATFNTSYIVKVEVTNSIE